MMYALIGLIAALIPGIVHAHAFGLEFTLPLPVSFYVTGGAAAFLISCALLVFVGTPSMARGVTYTFSDRAWRSIRRGLTTLFGLVLALGIGAGVFGHQAAYNNVLPVLFWIGLVLLVPYLSAAIDGLWDTGNPFRAFVDRILHLAPDRETAVWRYGYLPALAGYILLIILELFVSTRSTVPIMVVAILFAYTAMLVIGSKRYGADTWFRFADFFTVFFRLAGKVAPFRLRDGRFTIASPIARMAARGSEHLTLVLFVIFALAATAYDGLSETALLLGFAESVPFAPIWVVQFAVFVLFPVVFFALYAGAMHGMRRIVGGVRDTRAYMLRFIYSFAPIMLAYHFAHYFPLLITTGVTIIPLMADPFGLGWNLFGLAAFDTSSTLIGAEAVWYIQLASIVIGHAFAAYVAHHIALYEFADRWKALSSQIPLIVLMVFYTAFGLWILAQPFAPGVA